VSQSGLLTLIAEALDRIGIEWMLTGSHASSMHGEPRSTHDVDIVAEIHEEHIPALIRAFAEPRFYADANMMREAIQHRSMFNILDQDEGDKIDFWMVGEEESRRVQFSRRRRDNYLGVTVSVISPEDSIISKLQWSKLCGGSQKQFDDALSVYEIQQHNLEIPYCEEWASRLGVQDLWQRIIREAESLE